MGIIVLISTKIQCIWYNNIIPNQTFIIVYLLDTILLYNNLNNIYQTNKLKNDTLESNLFQEFNENEILKKIFIKKFNDN